uniref:Uncharacterized protein n=1 Tax=Oryza meridionalis TaxID=40149 RepID=A0A0E0EP59_9ORYZ
MERVPLLRDAALSAPRQLFVGSRILVTRWGASALVDTVSSLAISPSTLDLVAGRRPTAVGKNARRRRERQAASPELRRREREKREATATTTGSGRAATAPLSPPLEAHVVAAVGRRAETGGLLDLRLGLLDLDHRDLLHLRLGLLRTAARERQAAAAQERGESGGGGGWGGQEGRWRRRSWERGRERGRTAMS